jgi:type I restriction enzyme M protein
MKSLKQNGRAAIILPLGVLFRGNAEGTIRKAIVDRGVLEGIIAFPPNIFFGTGIPACVFVIDKAGAAKRDGIFMIDASRGFMKDGDKNRLRERDIEKIVSTYRARREEPHYSHFVRWDEIKRRYKYNLNIPRYIDPGANEDTQDIDGHLNGGIPSADIDGLGKFWKEFPSLRGKLFKTLRAGYEALNGSPDEVRDMIRGDAEFQAYAGKVADAFANWAAGMRGVFAGIVTDTNPKQFIRAPSMELMESFKGVGLLDVYDVYEVLLSYWTDVMSDDVYLIVDWGYGAGRETEDFKKEQLDKKTGLPKIDKKTGLPKVTITGWDGRIIPRAVLDRVYFSNEVADVRKAEAEAESSASAFNEYVEEQTQEGGCLFEYLTNADDGGADGGGADGGGETDDKVKLDKRKINADFRELKKTKPSDEDTLAIARYLDLEKAKKAAAKAAKEAAKRLEDLEKAKYQALTDEELKTLIVDEKWLATIRSGIDSLYGAVSNRLAERIAELAARYEATLGELDRECAELEAAVAAHLREMGY